MKTKSLFTLCFIILHSSFILSAHAQSTAFTYQGRLNDGANPTSGIYELRFAIYDSVGGGVQQGPTLTNSPTGVTNGLFTVTLDFGAGVFPGADRWLEIAVRTNGGGAFTSLIPRQPLTATPYAITAGNLNGTLSGTSLSGTYSSPVTLNNVANNFAGSGANLTALNANNLGSGTVPSAALGNAWQTTGNASTTPGTHFLGTTDNQPLELKVNNQRGLRLEPTATADTVNVIGGSAQNFVVPGVVGATISGGGTGDYYGDAYINRVEAHFGAVAGGYGNTIQTDAVNATIGGGVANTIAATSRTATIAGGWHNAIGTNSIESAIGGGSDNTIAANSPFATIAGGYGNAATGYAFAAGRRAKANHTGAFVWADSTDADFASTAANQFAIRASGGVGINTNNPNGAALAVNGNVTVNGSIGTSGDQPLEFKVNNQRGLRLEPTANPDTVNVIGGSALNSVGAGVVGATIGGGGTGNYAGEASTNRVEANFGTVSGGLRNTIQTGANYATIGGGVQNTIQNDVFDATIGGGYANTIQTIADCATIGGGSLNTIQPYANYATIPGGFMNAATDYAFAAGRRAKANHTGAFVWADSTDADFASTAANQFLIRAAGGVGIGTAAPETPLHVAGAGGITLGQSAAGGGYTALTIDLSSVQNGYAQLQAISQSGTSYGDLILQVVGGRVGIGKNNPGTLLDVNGTITCVSLNQTSDHNAKENFTTVSPREVLDKVATLPVSEWNFKNEPGTRHVGPMAQDFYAAFAIGTDAKHIATVDADGVALAAIQGLNQKVEEQRAENAALKRELSEIKQLLLKLSNKKD